MALRGGNKAGPRLDPRRLARGGMTKSRGPSAKVVLTRGALDEATRIVADGLFEAGKLIVQVASELAPDSPYAPYPEGEGLPKQGGVLAYAGGEKVNGWSTRGAQPAKPRALRQPAREHSVVVLVGFGFPGRFAERGTIKQTGQPFLAPARDAVAPRIVDIVGEVTRPKLAAAD